MLIGAGALLLLAGALAAEHAKVSDLPTDDGRPILVEGDSFAVGIAQALKQRFPTRNIDTTYAKTGQQALRMPALTDRDVFHIVSAGTNDAVDSRLTAGDVATRVLGVLGPYADGTAKTGYAALVLPHGKMGGTLGERADAVRAEIKKRVAQADLLRVNGMFPSRLALVEIRPQPASGDRIHFDGAGYDTIAQDALFAIAALRGARVGG
jgi:hypothetical protein